MSAPRRTDEGTDWTGRKGRKSFTDAVIREIREETGLIIRHPRLCGTRDWYDENGRYAALLYRAGAFSGELTSSEEGEVRWMSLDERLYPDLAEGMADALKGCMDDDLSECCYFEKDGIWNVRSR